MSKSRSAFRVRPAKRTARAIALFVIVAVAATAAFSVPSSAKVIETIFSNAALEPSAPRMAAAAVPAAAPQTQDRDRANQEEEEEGEDDADVPRFRAGKIDKEEYLRRRDEHVNKLRGVERGKPFDPGARGRAIRHL